MRKHTSVWMLILLHKSIMGNPIGNLKHKKLLFFFLILVVSLEDDICNY